MLSIGRSGIFYQYSLHGYPYKLPKRTYMGPYIGYFPPTSGEAYIVGL